MAVILTLISGVAEWETLHSKKHWKPGKSAHTLAHSWVAADGFPPEVSQPFMQSTEPLLANLTSLQAVPEFTVSLPGGVRASQNDIFVLARSSSGLVSIM